MGFEMDFLKLLEGLRTEQLIKLFELITMLGEEIILIFLIIILYFAYDKSMALRVFFVTIASNSVNGVVKNLVRRPRPFAVGDITPARVQTATGYSFPSGHTQTIATWSTTFAMKYKKWWVMVLAGLGIILVGFSRMFLGVHYPTDVIVGAILGIGISVLLNILYDKFQDKRKLYLIVFGILLPFAVYFLIVGDPMSKDFFKLYGMMAGLILAVGIEEKYAPLQYDVAIWKKIVRVVIGLAVAFAIKEGLKVFDVFGIERVTLLWSAFRYMSLVFGVCGLYPLLYKRLKI